MKELGNQSDISLGSVSLLLPRLPKVPSQCYSNGLGNLGNLTAMKKYSLSSATL